MDQRYAKLRVCASCEWIFRKVKGNVSCPKCGFGHYGARYVYGNKCYKYEITQKPWLDGKINDYTQRLQDMIDADPQVKKLKDKIRERVETERIIRQFKWWFKND